MPAAAQTAFRRPVGTKVAGEMKYVIAIGKGILMFVVSAIVIGAFLVLNWNLNMLRARIEGEKYLFSEAAAGPGSVEGEQVVMTVFESQSGDRVKIELTGNYFYDPCDAYVVTIMPASGGERSFSYIPDPDLKKRISSFNADRSRPIIPDFAVNRTFYYERRDITGFTSGAKVTNLLDGSVETLPKPSRGNAMYRRGNLGLSDDTYLVLDCITAFRNYLPFHKAIEPIYVWTPAFVFGEYIILGIINMSRDIYRKFKKKYEKEDFPPRRITGG
jgi:hypothetical protein